MHIVECLLEVDVVDHKKLLELKALFNDVIECKDLFTA